MFYVLYPFVTYLLTLPRILYWFHYCFEYVNKMIIANIKKKLLLAPETKMKVDEKRT
jgi:hypothetical protein